MKNREFRIGDAVRLNGGGPGMTVEFRPNDKWVKCCWFDAAGMLHHAEFLKECLTLTEQEPAPQVTPSSVRIHGIDMQSRCTQLLLALGKSAPKTCQVCKLGPCPFDGLIHKASDPVSAEPTEEEGYRILSPNEPIKPGDQYWRRESHTWAISHAARAAEDRPYGFHYRRKTAAE